jgi:hypothetical protein
VGGENDAVGHLEKIRIIAAFGAGDPEAGFVLNGFTVQWQINVHTYSSLWAGKQGATLRHAGMLVNEEDERPGQG